MAESDKALPEALRLAPEDRAVAPFLPVLCAAWADGELTPAEVAGISTWLGLLDGGLRDLLRPWLDPASPPPAARLRRILGALRVAAEKLPDTGSLSLAGLGLELARQIAPGEPEPGPGIWAALTGIERSLGLATPEAALRLLDAGRPQPETAEEEARPAFDPRSLQAFLDAPYGDVRDKVRTLIASPAFAGHRELDRAAYREQVLAWCRELAGYGLGALGYPVEQGGGGDLGRFIAAFETLAFGDLGLLVKFGVQFGLFGGSIQQLGTARHHDAYLREVGTLDLPGCFAMSETGHGSNVADLQTAVRFDPAAGDFVLHTPDPLARKDWIGNAALHGRMATVFAQLEVGGEPQGVHAFLVPIRGADGAPAPGVHIEDCGGKEGLEGVDNGRLTFDHVRVPRENLLDRFASVSAEGVYSSPISSSSRRFFTMLGTLVGGRISVAAAALSAAKSGLAIAVRYGSRRRQFGPPGRPEVVLLDYPSHQRRLMPRLAACYALDFAHKDLVRRYLARTEQDAREVEGLAAGLKAWASWQTVETLQNCRECCGGQGYLTVNRLPALKADTDVFTTFEGDNTVLMQLVAKGCLTQYRDQFHDLNAATLLRYIASRAALVLADLNPILARNTSEEHLRDPEFQLAALRHREQHLLVSAARRLETRIKKGTDSFSAFQECQDHLLRLANAYVERVILERFVAAVGGVEEGELRRILETLRDLFALWRIEADRGWFLETGHMEGNKTKAIRSLVDRLCAEVRSHALPLVDAFGIPDACLPPIAF